MNRSAAIAALSPVGTHRFKLVAIGCVLAVLYAGKHYYSAASAADLDWILAPTAHLVSFVGGHHFTYEAGAGWVDRDVTFIIAPACAGVNFMLAAFMALTFGWLGTMLSWRATARRLAIAAALAYVATLIVNTIRIAIAIAMHRGTIDVGSLDHGEAHRIEGILIYLGGLCALYAIARAASERSKTHALLR
ncbi:MAG: exosortase [Myxococcales bacterium]|nr:exosortase [Myxococcales bacterium]